MWERPTDDGFAAFLARDKHAATVLSWRSRNTAMRESALPAVFEGIRYFTYTHRQTDTVEHRRTEHDKYNLLGAQIALINTTRRELVDAYMYALFTALFSSLFTACELP